MVQRKKPADSLPNSEAQGDSASSGTNLIANLLALGLVQGKPQEEQIVLLAAAGYPTAKIASLLGTTPNTVSVTLSKRRSAGKSKGKRKR